MKKPDDPSNSKPLPKETAYVKPIVLIPTGGKSIEQVKREVAEACRRAGLLKKK